MAKAKAPKEHVEQGYLNGQEPPRIRAIDQAARIYFDTMQDRCKLSKEEDEAKTNLIDKMKEHNLAFYECPNGLVVTVTEKSNVKCKKKNAESNGEEEGGSDASS